MNPGMNVSARRKKTAPRPSYLDRGAAIRIYVLYCVNPQFFSRQENYFAFLRSKAANNPPTINNTHVLGSGIAAAAGGMPMLSVPT
jgi:hypothetical protein